MKYLFCAQLCEKQKMTFRLQRFILSNWGKRTLGQWFYKYGPQMSSILILWELVRMADSQLTPGTKELETIEGWDLQSLSQTLQVIQIYAKIQEPLF